MLIAPCYHNFVFIIHSAEFAQHLSYIFISLRVILIISLRTDIATNSSVVEGIEVVIVCLYHHPVILLNSSLSDSYK